MKPILKIEFIPGDDIGDAFSEAIRLAKLLDIVIEFRFNDVICLTNESGEVDKGVAMYFDQIKKRQALK